VDPDDRVPLVLGHVDQHPVPEDAGVVHQDVEGAEGIHGVLNHPFGAVPAGHVLGVGDRLAARVQDLPHDLVGRAFGASVAVQGGPDVVDHDLRPVGGQEEGVLATDATARPGDDAHATFTESCHGSHPGTESLRMITLVR